MSGSARPDGFNPLDMRNYRMETLPVREKSRFEQLLARVGLPLAILAFVLILASPTVGFLRSVDATTLPEEAKATFEKLGAAGFVRVNTAMLAAFAGALILWMTEALPSYLTSLILIITLVLTGVLSEVKAYAQLGHPIMWLNILSFILASMLVATGVAKRFALWFLLRYGRSPTSIFLSFIVINVVLSAFISATTAKAAILLPVFMVVAAVYGARGGTSKTNFGRSLVLHNLYCINVGAGAFVTGSGANLLAASLIAGAVQGRLFFQDWLVVAFPPAMFLLLTGWFVATRVVFPLSEEARRPKVEGGLESLRHELVGLGPLRSAELRAVVIFLVILALWATDKYHGVSATAVAFLGAIVALLPRVGVITWNQVDVPWHLLIFSAGAYTLGAGLDVTGLPSLMVNAGFDALGLGKGTPFWALYVLLTGSMLFSALIFESKTMRTMIFIPIAIGVANRFGFPVLSLALPVALLISWGVYLVMGETYFRLLGYCPSGVFGLF